MSFVQLLGALSVDWMSPMNQGGAWSRALLAKPNLLVATRSSSGRAMASALTPRLVRAPCKNCVLEGLFGLKGLGSSDCHVNLVPDVAFIQSAKVLVASNNCNGKWLECWSLCS